MSSCHRADKLPEGVLAHNEMVSFLSEAYLLEGFYAVESGFRYETMSPQIRESYNQLLAKYNLTDADFERSIEYYVAHDEEYAAIHQEVIANLDQMMNE